MNPVLALYPRYKLGLWEVTWRIIFDGHESPPHVVKHRYLWIACLIAYSDAISTPPW